MEINKDARDQLVLTVGRIAKARVSAGQPPIGSLIITGDVAYSGLKEQFDEAVTWLATVSAVAGSDPLSIQVIPGNHDVDRGKSLMVGSMLKSLFRFGHSYLEKVLVSTDDRGALYNRMRAYQEFANGYGCELDTTGGAAGEKMHMLAEGRTLRILGSIAP